MSIVSKFLEAIKSFSQKTKSPAKHTYGIPAVEFDPSLVTETVKADIRKNVELLEEIDPKHFDQVYEAAVRSVTAGREMYSLVVTIMQMNITDMTKQRAGQIAHNLNNKAMAVITRERQQRLGITEAIWLHPHPQYPCDICSKTPKGTQTKCASHMAANGKRYNVSEGMYLDGKWTWPGYEEGCGCVSKSVVSGLS